MRLVQYRLNLNLSSSRDRPATANETTSVELLAMLECSVWSTSERCYEEANITERSYSHTTFFQGICHYANELTMVDSYL